MNIQFAGAGDEGCGKLFTPAFALRTFSTVNRIIDGEAISLAAVELAA